MAADARNHGAYGGFSSASVSFLGTCAVLYIRCKPGTLAGIAAAILVL